MLCLDEGKRARLGRPSMTPYALRLASALWETSSVLLIEGDEAVAIDPGITQSEIEAVRDRGRRGGRTGRRRARDARATSTTSPGSRRFPRPRPRWARGRRPGSRAATRCASWSRRARRSGCPGPGSHVATGSSRVGRRELVGPFAVETMELAGHTDCGVGYRLRDPDVLIVGDYLSPIEYPFVYHSTAAYRSTLAGLADLLRRDPPALVVPGHGAPLDAADALAIAEQDLGYLHAPAQRRRASGCRGSRP